MNHIRTCFVTMLTLLTLNCLSQKRQTDSLLTVLKKEIKKEPLYDSQKTKQIQALKRGLTNFRSLGFDAQFKLDSLIFEQYMAFKYDSAFTYATRMANLSRAYHDKPRRIESTLLLSNILLNSGMYKEAFDQLNKVDTNTMSKALKSEYFIISARLNNNIAEYDNDAVYAKTYRRLSDADFKRADRAGPANDFERTLKLAFTPDSMKQRKLTADFFFDYITRHHVEPHNLAMAATRLSYAFSGEDKIRFLALAAINDIRSSTKETLAVLLLGQELFRTNNTPDAYISIQEAIANARFYGARGHQVQIESILPIIASKVLAEKQHERDEFLIGLLIVVIIAVVLFFLLVIYRRQILQIKAHERVISEKNTELEKVNEKLWESSRIKEEFIGLFFKSCSHYIETLEKMKRKIQHNIKLEKYNEVNALLESIRIEKERDNLYDTLDSIFLTLFPNFITSFNMLLSEEDQVWPKKGESLNASLRIFALTRLGVNELEAIAKILNYSVSTVYTYKVRIKAKSLIGADEFEKKVMEIKFTDSKPAK